MGEVAAQEKAVFLDHYDDWLDGNGGRVPLSLLNDGLHPDERGHHRIVLEMIRDPQLFDPAGRVCALSAPRRSLRPRTVGAEAGHREKATATAWSSRTSTE
ncbi:hypothetical protein ACWZEH_29475 [Streptomyces sp. QTS137]